LLLLPEETTIRPRVAVSVDPSRLMGAAIELALESVGSGGGPFGAVVVRSGRIVGRGTN